MALKVSAECEYWDGRQTRAKTKLKQLASIGLTEKYQYEQKKENIICNKVLAPATFKT
ncbi:hypothetical protein ASPWEDRAFT_514922 [Aspergillus wentii DTO 134E9]|uniref:Uncharacterized protein n=1 Tax=Aspergillus wentii DTO 134E9 TaxID=1073089 RepID=A0A1L9RKV2_ASPWE|nr:uncharacterized protein ASPWEDRAFT_514922 [Aspergillus wentii DTO 134E9]OJJ35565.1 hypothetical protein ASPWEDRAFT_514922 [Aspergillus wentii DTO 134E9]